MVIAVTDPQSVRLLSGVPEALSDAGWEVHLVVGAPLARTPSRCVVHVVPMVRAPAPLRDLRALALWIVLLARIRPQTVMAGTPKAGLLGTTAAAIVRVPTRIYHLRGLRLETARGLSYIAYRVLERVAMVASTEVLAVSSSLIDRCVELKLARRSKFVVLGAGSSNGVDTTHYVPTPSLQKRSARRALDLSVDLPTVLFVGRVTPDKGVNVLTEAATSLAASMSFAVVFFGQDEQPGLGATLISRLRSAGVDARHVDTGGDPLPYYQAADVLCLPSFREGFPNVVLEAAACGLPAISTDATGCRDAVVAGQTGWVVVTGSVESLASSLEQALSDQARCAALGAAARRRVERLYDRTRHQSQLVAYLAETSRTAPVAGGRSG